jgi:hypothetical protein
MSLAAIQASAAEIPFSETVFYGDGLAWITDKRVVFHETMHWLVDIKSASMEVIEENRSLAWPTIYICAFIVVGAGSGLALIFHDPANIVMQWFGYFVLAFVLALLLIVLFAPRHLVQATIYTLRLADAKGSSIAFASLDESYIQRLIGMINSAVEKRSETPDVPSQEWQESSRSEDTGGIYYQDGRNMVSTTRIVLEGKPYVPSDVRGAYLLPVRHDKWKRFTYITSLLYLVYFILFMASFVTSDSLINLPIFFIALACQVALGISTLAHPLVARYVWLVVIKSPAGRVAAAATLKQYYAKHLVNVIKMAIKSAG